MTGRPAPDFDFAAYAAAIEAKDAARWSGFFADEAEWSEYRVGNPPRSPHVMAGIDAIRSFVERVAASPVRLGISHEVVGPSRAAYRLTVALQDGRTIVEHVIVELADGRIVSQADVEAWD